MLIDCVRYLIVHTTYCDTHTHTRTPQTRAVCMLLRIDHLARSACVTCQGDVCCMFLFVFPRAMQVKFAILQARLALASIVQAFDCTPTPGKPKLEYTFGVLQGPSCLWLDFTRRSNARAHLMTHEE